MADVVEMMKNDFQDLASEVVHFGGGKLERTIADGRIHGERQDSRMEED